MTVIYSVTSHFREESHEQFFTEARPAFDEFDHSVVRAKEINSKSMNGASTVILAAYDLKDNDMDALSFLVAVLNRTGFSHVVIDLDRWEAREEYGLADDEELGDLEVDPVAGGVMRPIIKTSYPTIGTLKPLESNDE